MGRGVIRGGGSSPASAGAGARLHACVPDLAHPAAGGRTIIGPDRIGTAVRTLLGGGERLVLAVSGGVDSMVLLHAVAHARPGGGGDGIVVATFDHASGAHAAAAVDHVRRLAGAWGVPVVTGRAAAPMRGEAAWREARWRFLRDVAGERSARIATAHTRDDQLETIVMRALRGAGARGLSALLAPSDILRPFLDVSRAAVERYADAHAVPWIEDPTNRDRAHLRNRVRLDLLPAMRALSPGFDEAMLALARRAAEVRRACAAIARDLVVDVAPGRVVATRVTNAEWPAPAQALLWQAIAETGGIVLDRRGTVRLAHFGCEGRPGTLIPLSGGFEAVHRHETIELRRRLAAPTDRVTLRLEGATIFGAWRFRALEATNLRGSEITDARHAWLPADVPLEVRPWRAGDRMLTSGSRPRRVKRFLADRRVVAADRAGWPVVVAGGEIVWIPGVRRGHAATVRSGRPRVCFVCERVND